MDTRITDAELARDLAAVLDRVRHRAERFVVESGGEVIATISPSGQPVWPTPRELSARLGELRVPDAELAEDLAQVRREQPPTAGER